MYHAQISNQEKTRNPKTYKDIVALLLCSFFHFFKHYLPIRTVLYAQEVEKKMWCFSQVSVVLIFNRVAHLCTHWTAGPNRAFAKHSGWDQLCDDLWAPIIPSYPRYLWIPGAICGMVGRVPCPLLLKVMARHSVLSSCLKSINLTSAPRRGYS